jgi:fumarate reductase flavoprotein subunit
VGEIVNYQISAEKECEIVVLGGGGGGMVAAARAASISGNRVIILEKAAHTGGAAIFASTHRTFKSKWQKDRGIPDVMDEFIVKAMDRTFWRLDPRLVGNVFRATGEFFDWFLEVGEENLEDQFEAGNYVFDGPSGPLGPILKGSGEHHGAGKVFMATMLDVCRKRGVQVLTRHKAVDVEVKNGKITAVVAESENGFVRIACKACILATGSWIRNKEVVEKICPKYLEAKIDIGFAAHCNPNYTGDGIPLAKKAGAFVDYDSFCLRLIGPMSGKSSERTSVVMQNMGYSPYTIFVNLNGERWCCEAPQRRMGVFNSGHALLGQPQSVSFAVFDENNLAAAIKESRKPHEGLDVFLGCPKFPKTMDKVYADMDRGIGARGAGHSATAYKAATLQELAKKIGVDAKGLIETVAGYNAFCKAGEDFDFFKPARNLVPLDKPPFYAVKGPLGTDGAFGGVRVNPDMQAYKDGGGLVEGFYVVGDFASGRHIVLGGAKEQVINDSAWAFAGGFIAGSSACRYLDKIHGSDKRKT